MYTALITKIQETIDSVDKIKESFAYPEAEFTQFPAVVFYPEEVQNSFETTLDNMKIYRFKLWIIIGVKGTTKQDIFTSKLPDAVDAVVQAFDDNWNAGIVNDHRGWFWIDVGRWGLSPDQDGETAYAEIVLNYKTLTTNNS